MVALPPTVERDALVADEHLAVDRARLLVAGHAGIPEDVARRLPLEVEPERGAVAPLAAVRLGGVVERHAERLEVDAPVVVGGLAHQLGPETLGAHLQRPLRGHRRLVVAHGHERAALSDQIGPVPGAPLVGEQPEAHVATEGAVGVGEVEVPRLAPQRLGTGLVALLVVGVIGVGDRCVVVLLVSGAALVPSNVRDGVVDGPDGVTRDRPVEPVGHAGDLGERRRKEKYT